MRLVHVDFRRLDIKSVKLLLKFLVVLAGLAVYQLSIAAVDPVIFDSDEAMQKRYQEITRVLRCPKCQNQSIAGSDAPIAKDMRRKVESLMKDGQTNEQIERFMIDRYGDFVTYNPPLSSRTYVLWFAPPIFLFVVAASFIAIFRKSKSSPADQTENSSATSEETERDGTKEQ